MEKITRSHEETARRHNQTIGMLFTGVSWGMFFICAIIAFMTLQGLVTSLASISSEGFNLVGTLINVGIMAVFGGLAYLCWRNKDRLRIEYDYTFTPITGGTADLDVAQVMGNSRRRLMTSLSLKIVESAGPVDGSSFQRYISMRDVKKHNWFVNRDAKLYYFYFVKNEVKHIMIVELRDEMLDYVKPYLNMGVWQG